MTNPVIQAQGRIPLPELAVLQIQGADAAAFLQGQLTNDVVGLAPDQACVAGYCTAKGRLLATLVVWRTAGPDGAVFHALVRSDIAQSLVKRLTMFVLRAKVSIRITAQRVSGEVAAATPDAAPAWATQTDAATGVTRIQAPCGDAAAQRAWLVSPATDSDASQDSASIVQDALEAGANAAWQAGDIRAGFGWISAANQDLYIPQTLNLDLIGGINFRKGCYPGQEVVARSHYRGTLKRRMAYGTADAPAAIGIDLYDAHNPANPCGRVINQANDGQATHLLLEVQLADMASADFRLGDAQGATVTLQPLPYALMPAD